jgi:hypothetical protein
LIVWGRWLHGHCNVGSALNDEYNKHEKHHSWNYHDEGTNRVVEGNRASASAENND